MKILIVSSNDTEGGAGRASYRLHKGLQRMGIDSRMLVQKRDSGERTVLSPVTKLEQGIARMKPTLDSLPTLLYRDRAPGLYSSQWLPDRLAGQVARIAPDIINLHWINGGFLQIETPAKFNRPLVWTLHDMWALTGGCHYSGDCDRYTGSCGNCPQLGSHRERDLSRWIWQRKARAWKNLPLTIVTPSRWLASLARQSSLLGNLPIEAIPNGLDIQRYKPIERKIARNLLGLPPDKRLVLFGAVGASSDRRKGFHLLQPALQKLGGLVREKDRLELVVFGASEPENPPDFGLKTNYAGMFGDDISLALLYAAADVFVAPSLEDNLPNTVMEALACGTPCVAFSIGGMSDMIEPGENGYLASPFDVEDFARGIVWVLEDENRYYRLSERAREKVTREFTLEIQAANYRQLFDRTLDSFRETAGS